MADGIHRATNKGTIMPAKITPTLKVQPKDPSFKRLTASLAARPDPFDVARYIAPRTKLTTMRISPKKLMDWRSALPNPNGAIRNRSPLAAIREWREKSTGRSGL